MKSIAQPILFSLLQTGIGAVVIPVGLISAWKVASKKKLRPFFIGMAGYLLFVCLLKFIPDLFVTGDTSIGMLMKDKVIQLNFYESLIVTFLFVFGAFTFLKFFYMKYSEKQYAVTFAIGFAGAGTIVNLGFRFFKYHFYGNLINLAIEKKDDSILKGAEEIYKEIKNITITYISASSISQVFMFILETSVVIMLFYAVRARKIYEKAVEDDEAAKGTWLENAVPMRIVMFAGAFLFAGQYPYNLIYNRYITSMGHIIACEVICGIISVAAGLVAKNMYDHLSGKSVKYDAPEAKKKRNIASHAKKKLSNIEIDEESDK
ncbi:MAG: YhfC family intramembrane metalloprotease [Lachnospiraceae bacterium]|nr:YhfC family intramembrane metalloprotease [Lachnospiraceae bacterium]